MRNDKENIIVEKSFQFALEIVLYCELLEEKKKYVLSRQLLRSGTSIGLMSVKHKTKKAKLILFIKLS